MLPWRALVPLTQDLVAKDGYNPDPMLEIEKEKLFTVFKLALTFQKIRRTFQHWEDYTKFSILHTPSPKSMQVAECG